MNRAEHLLTCLSEECHEVGQRATKALRFGLKETQKGQSMDNSERLIYELSDLFTIYEMLKEEGHVPDLFEFHETNKDKKRAQVEEYLLLSKKLGTLTE